MRSHNCLYDLAKAPSGPARCRDANLRNSILSSIVMRHYLLTAVQIDRKEGGGEFGQGMEGEIQRAPEWSKE